MNKISGIYCIRNKNNNKIYVGSAVDIFARWRNHVSALRANRHANKHLQNAWNQDTNFELVVLEEVVDTLLLIEREQYYIDTTLCYDRIIGYNICRTAGSKLGLKLSESVRKKISESHKGIRHTTETKNKLSIAASARVIPGNIKKLVDTVTGKIYNSVSEAAAAKNTSISYLSQQLNGFRTNKTNLEYY